MIYMGYKSYKRKKREKDNYEASFRIAANEAVYRMRREKMKSIVNLRNLRLIIYVINIF